MISPVHESKVTLANKDLGQLVPLRLGRVDAGRVVSAVVEQNDAALGSRLECARESFPVEADVLGVVVRVLNGVQAYVVDDRVVVRCNSVSRWFTRTGHDVPHVGLEIRISRSPLKW